MLVSWRNHRQILLAHTVAGSDHSLDMPGALHGRYAAELSFVLDLQRADNERIFSRETRTAGGSLTSRLPTWSKRSRDRYRAPDGQQRRNGEDNDAATKQSAVLENDLVEG